MLLDVLLVRDADQSTKTSYSDYPVDWPIECVEREDDAPAPVDPWVRMTVPEYAAYRAAPARRSAAESASQARKAADQASRGPTVAERIAALETRLTELERVRR